MKSLCILFVSCLLYAVTAICPFVCDVCEDGTCKSCTPGNYLQWDELGNTYCPACQAHCTTCTSDKKCTACEAGHYGNTCEHDCQKHCIDGTCNIDGCIVGCKGGYFQDNNNVCQRCRHNCLFCSSYEICDKCIVGYYTESTSPGHAYCFRCPIYCSSCTSSTQCNACATGYYGVTCANSCQTHCIDGECTQNGCTKGCKQWYYKDIDNVCQFCRSSCKTCTNRDSCDSCLAGRYEADCKTICKSRCTDGTCDITTGDCKSTPTCPEGQFQDPNGQCSACSSLCKACATINTQCTKCHRGHFLHDETCTACPNGCKDCRGASVCDSCNDGFYRSGQSCFKCPNTCTTCTLPNHCTSCKSGHFLSSWKCRQCPLKCSTCSTQYRCQSCKQGYQLSFGKCVSCNAECRDQKCDSDGTCNNGCISSDRYGRTCEMSCRETIPNCSECDTTVLPIACVSCISGYVLRSGQCTACTSNDIEASCNKDGSTSAVTGGDHDNTAAVVGGAVGGGVLLVVVLIVIFVVIRKRRHKQTSGEQETHIPLSETGHASDTGRAASPITTDGMTENVYAKPMKDRPKRNVSVEVHQPVLHGDSSAARLPGGSVQYFMNEDDDGEIDIEEYDGNLTSAPEPEHIPDTYYNMAGLIRSRLAVDKLQVFVRTKTKDDFVMEFEKLPIGLTRPFNAAMQNRDRNRYQKIYPYDASRVVLKSGPSDYINASYIDSNIQYNVYIASQGPTNKTMPGFESFWTMVWQEKVEVIVMLTNLTEGTTMKCEQYWPDTGTSKVYGDVTVTCHSEDMYAEYTVRSFTVQNDEKRALHHVHYTAWPDKGVPDDVTSLIEFRQKVISCPITLAGPTIVHCSAGVGRTGTYIALDILTREGRVSEAVDVLGCVMALRGQRVSMVQTAEQYEYLHNALVHSLTFDCEPIQADTVRQLVTPNHTETLQAQFGHLNQTKDSILDDETKAVADNTALSHKNRRGADVPGNRHRPWLHMFRSADSSCYINAVYVNSFKRKDQYVVAQTPLPTTVEDFLTLVIQTNCPCIVSLDDHSPHDKTVGVYIPAVNEVSKHGIFQVKCISRETTPQYTLRQLEISTHGKTSQEPWAVYHFQCTMWIKEDTVPNDSIAFMQLTRDVEKMSPKIEDTGPIIVHCLTGAERSGLFCVVSVLIQKMEIEHQVSVVNTVRQVKARRRRAILDKDQYQFCHECLAVYIQSFDTYSNFSQ